MNPARPSGEGTGGKLAGNLRVLEPGRLVLRASLPDAAQGELILRDEASGAELRKPLAAAGSGNGECESVIELSEIKPPEGASASWDVHVSLPSSRGERSVAPRAGSQ